MNATTAQPSAAASFLVQTSKAFGPNHRLNVVVIGAATEMASALLMDPTMANRVRVVAMAFKNLSPEGAHEYNEMNDPAAWRVLLDAQVPLVVGTGDVCERYLSLTPHQAETLLHDHGPRGGVAMERVPGLVLPQCEAFCAWRTFQSRG